MQQDFHYYATYVAACLAGYSPETSLKISYSAQLVDWCSKTLLDKLHAPLSAATTQLKAELANARTDFIGLQDITRIWASFHFLPYDLYAEPGKGGKLYCNKYRLICKPNGPLVAKTVGLARGRGAEAVGLAMHVLADTWAHQNFAGTPSLVINNTSTHFFELLGEGDAAERRRVTFRHNPTVPDDFEHGFYTNSLYQADESSVMNLGHGRAGHLPDYSFVRYAYLPAWDDYEEIIKDNPSDYWMAFCQMVYALRCLREKESFEVERYEQELIQPWEEEIRAILVKRQLDSCADWRELGERLSGHPIPPFDLGSCQKEYLDAPTDAKDDTFLGRFILASLAQKSMVTNQIYRSGSLLAGVSLDYNEKGLAGIKDYFSLLRYQLEEVGS